MSTSTGTNRLVNVGFLLDGTAANGSITGGLATIQARLVSMVQNNGEHIKQIRRCVDLMYRLAVRRRVREDIAAGEREAAFLTVRSLK